VSADGQRFLMFKPVEQAQAATQIVVVQNWFEELKQKVPTENNHSIAAANSFSVPGQAFKWNRLQPVRFGPSFPKLTG